MQGCGRRFASCAARSSGANLPPAECLNAISKGDFVAVGTCWDAVAPPEDYPWELAWFEILSESEIPSQGCCKPHRIGQPPALTL